MNSAEHAARDILVQLPRYLPRRERAGRIRVYEDRHHHLRIERLVAAAVALVRGIERREIEGGHRVRDEEREVPFG